MPCLPLLHPSPFPITEPNPTACYKLSTQVLHCFPSSIVLDGVSLVCAPFHLHIAPSGDVGCSSCKSQKQSSSANSLTSYTRAKQNRLEKMDYRMRGYCSTAQGQLYFQCQQVIKVSHFWQEHLTNEIQTIMLWTSMFLQCFNGPNSRSWQTVCSGVSLLC